MNRVTRGTVVLAAALVVMSCEGDPMGDLRNGADHLVATPSAIFLTSGASDAVVVEVVDKQGNRLQSSFSIDFAAPGITVVGDTAYNNVYNNKGVLVEPSKWTRARFLITATANTGNLSFTIKAGGKSLDIPVRVIPANLTLATLNDAAPALGDTVTITAPAPFKFTPASVVSAGAAAIVPTGMAADSSSISFLPGPSANSPVSVTNSVLNYAPGAGTFVLTSTADLVTAAVTSYTAALSSAAPANSQAVTITLTAGFKFLPTAVLTHGSGSGVPVAIISRAADSSAITFIPAPGQAASALYADDIVLSFLTAVGISDLPSTVTITPPAPYAGTDAFATAPVVTVPTAGNTTNVVDATPFNSSTDCDNQDGGFDCRIYTFTVPAAVTLRFNNTWDNGADLGLYFSDAGGSGLGIGGCDGKGAGAGSQPETCSVNFTAGTYFMQMTTYHPFYAAPNNVAPDWFRIQVTGS